MLESVRSRTEGYLRDLALVADRASSAPGTFARDTLAYLSRDLFGNPFRLITFSQARLTESDTTLAAGIYADRAFDRLPILADALQDAGCEDKQVLAHCRGDGPHARGCRVVDGVLGKG